MSVTLAFGWIGIMLCIGMILRAKVPFLRKMLVPASVIGGLFGLVLMNLNVLGEVSAELYTTIVNELFIISFISIGLTSMPKSKNGKKGNKGNVAKGSLGMGLVWCILYGIIPLVGVITLSVIGPLFGMDSIYGLLLPFAFTQGPGQAATYGTMFEGYGLQNAAMIGVTFAAVGFLLAFLVGVPLVKWGLKKGLAKNVGELDESILKGYFNKEKQKESIGTVTTYSGNIETVAFHFALIGLCYVLAIGISNLFALIPGTLGEGFSGMVFMNGMYAAFIVKFVMKKLNMEYLQDNVLQTKLTGWAADFLVVAAFMAVQFSVIGQWMIPILIVCIITVVVTLAASIYFGQRFGGENDFERTVGLYGLATGTTPSAIALIRIINPNLESTTATELGMMNLVMIASTPIALAILGIVAGDMSMGIGFMIFIGLALILMIVMRVIKVWGRKTYNLRTGEIMYTDKSK